MQTKTMEQGHYTPDWPSIPAGFDWVAVDMDGEVYAYKTKPFPAIYLWVHDDDECLELKAIEAPPDDSWREMIYERPKDGSPQKQEYTLTFDMGNLLCQFKEFPLVALYPNGEKWFWECLTSEAAVKHEDLITCLEMLLAEINKKKCNT